MELSTTFKVECIMLPIDLRSSHISTYISLCVSHHTSVDIAIRPCLHSTWLNIKMCCTLAAVFKCQFVLLHLLKFTHLFIFSTSFPFRLRPVLGAVHNSHWTCLGLNAAQAFRIQCQNYSKCAWETLNKRFAVNIWWRMNIMSIYYSYLPAEYQQKNEQLSCVYHYKLHQHCLLEW